MEWLVDIKDHRETAGAWEISVIREDNKHGFRSYGWFSDEKILISKGGGSYSPWSISQFVFDSQIVIAVQLAKLLSNGVVVE